MCIKSQSINPSDCFSEMTETIKPEIENRNGKRGKLLHPFALIHFLIPIFSFLKGYPIPLSENTYIKFIAIHSFEGQGPFDWGYIG